jgi:hypothetical protein
MVYNMDNANLLLSSVKRLDNFDDVKIWDNNAEIEIKKMINAISIIDTEIEKYQFELDETSIEFKKKSFLIRAITSDKISKKISEEIEKNKSVKAKIEELKSQLEDFVNMTPNDESEAKSILHEMRIAKKELTIQKKELRMEIKLVNQKVKERNISISNQIIFTSPKLRKWQKQDLRTKQFNQNVSTENSIQYIDSKLNEIDRMIIWIERIKFK